MAVAAGSLSSCKDDFGPEGGLPEGTEIQFGAALDDEATRTYYDEKDLTNNVNTAWKIYWNYPGNPRNLPLDQIYIYSPQGAAGRNQATFTVKATEADQKTAAQIDKIGEIGVQAGTASQYDFYGMYPASAVTQKADGTTFHATLNGAQQASYLGSDGKVTTLPKDPATNSSFILAADMNNCLMTTSHTDVTLTDAPVSLQFKPFSSMLDITINGPMDNNTVTGNDNCYVTSVVVTADAPISGDFNYDFKTGNFTFPQTGTDDGNKSIRINTMMANTEGNITGVPMANGSTLRVQAFMIPNPAVSKLTVTVRTSDNMVWNKELNMGTATNPLFKPTQIHKVVLPKLKFAEATFDYSMWISQLDPRIYISEISLPGTVGSFTQSATGTNQLQELSIADQFKAGIRVFQAHAWLSGTQSAIDGGPSLMLNVNGTTIPNGSLLSVAQELCALMDNNHSDEFCVLMISDYSTSSGGYSYSDFIQRLNKLTEHLAGSEYDYLAKDVDANTTINDVKGKVIVKLAANLNSLSLTSGSLGNVSSVNTRLTNYKSLSDDLGTSKSLINFFYGSSNGGGDDAGSHIFYSPMSYGAGVFSYTGSFNWEISREWETGSGLSHRYHREYSYKSPTLSITQPGVATQEASELLANAQSGRTEAEVIVPTSFDLPANSASWTSSIASYTATPSEASLNDNIWYIYYEQSDASKLNSSLISSMTDAIKNTYNQTVHNKFYMTYLGGQGSDNASVSSGFISTWNSAIGATSAAWGKRPLGWVLVNMVPSADTPDADLSEAQKTIRNAIKRVISQNNDVDFKLARDHTQSATALNDATSKNRGPLFVKRRR